MDDDVINAQQDHLADLAAITDEQRVDLAQIAYVDLTDEGLQKVENGGLTISEMTDYLKYPDDPSSGYMLGTQELTEKCMDMGDIVETDTALCQNLIDSGLGDLKVTDITMNPDTGFCAMTFEDELGNTGISYRGSDFDYGNGAGKDWLLADISEHFIGDSTQAKEANQYFAEHADPSGNNYIYGYSLGGNLVSHTYLENHAMIQEAFSINGNAIDPDLINTKELEDAFNDPKYQFCMIEGDIVTMLKDTSKYRDNIRVIDNQGDPSSNFIDAHSLSSAKFDGNGNFVEIPYAEMEKTMAPILGETGQGLVNKLQENSGILGQTANIWDTFGKGPIFDLNDQFKGVIGDSLDAIKDKFPGAQDSRFASTALGPIAQGAANLMNSKDGQSNPQANQGIKGSAQDVDLDLLCHESNQMVDLDLLCHESNQEIDLNELCSLDKLFQPDNNMFKNLAHDGNLPNIASAIEIFERER